jgi:phage terminase large subunit
VASWKRCDTGATSVRRGRSQAGPLSVSAISSTTQDVYRYQSAEFQYVGFDELTQFTEKQYTYLFSRLRRLKDFAVPLRMRSASNPGGIGHTWVKRRFVDERAPGVVFIPAGVKDSSAYLDVNAYVQSLSELSPTLRQQLLEGDWGAFEGAAFQDFNRALHCIPRIQIEDFWERFESMDYGISNPTAWLFWVVDGEGNLIVTDSHYAPGLPSETAPIILKKRQLWRSAECFGDPASLAQRTSTVNRFGEASTIESEFADLGVPLARAHNDPRAGYTRLRELIKPDPKHRFPDWHPFRGRQAHRTCSSSPRAARNWWSSSRRHRSRVRTSSGRARWSTRSGSRPTVTLSLPAGMAR